MTDGHTPWSLQATAAARVPARPGLCLRLGLVLLLVVAALAIPRPAPATARPYETMAARTYALSAAGPFVTDSDQHGIEKREDAPQASERKVARGVAGLAQQTPPYMRPHPILPTRLWDRIPAAPSSRANVGQSPRAPPE